MFILFFCVVPVKLTFFITNFIFFLPILTPLLNSKNTGGGIFLLGSKVEIRGRNSNSTDPGKVLIARNEAKVSAAMLISAFQIGPNSIGGNGGGIMIRGDHRGTTGGIVVQKEGHLNVMENKAHHSAGGLGLYSHLWNPIIPSDRRLLDIPTALNISGTAVISNNSASFKGGGMMVFMTRVKTSCDAPKNPLVIISGDEATLNVSQNEAAQGGGMSLIISGDPPRQAFSSAAQESPCASLNRTKDKTNLNEIRVSKGAVFSVHHNTAYQMSTLIEKIMGPTLLYLMRANGDLIANYDREIIGGALMLDHTQLNINGPGSRVTIQNNIASTRGGGIFLRNGLVRVENKGTLYITANVALQSHGGGLLFSHSSLMRVHGYDSTATFAQNRAGGDRGGGFSTESGSSQISITGGASFFVSSNTASNHGGGGAIAAKSGIFSDSDSDVMFEGNTARRGDGGALAVTAGSYARLEGTSQFVRNVATNGAGGALGAPVSGIDSGNANCVDVIIHIQLENAEPGPAHTSERGDIRVSVSPILLQFEEFANWTDVRDKKTRVRKPETRNFRRSECLPCGEIFRLSYSPVDIAGARPFHKRTDSYLSVRYAPRLGLGEAEVLRVDLTMRMWGSEDFTVNCGRSGFWLQNTVFSGNRAQRGGALASDTRRNIFFEVKRGTFVGNTATETGGAAHLSGFNTGARFEDGCKFEGNSAKHGGAVSVGNSAAVHVMDTIAENNAASRSGGFLFASFARSSLLQNVSIADSRAEKGDGGALSLSASRIALEDVRVFNSTAGGDGGAIMLQGKAVAHLLGTYLENNRAEKGRGGQVAVASSLLVAHSPHTSLAWPLDIPLTLATTRGARSWVRREEASSGGEVDHYDCSDFIGTDREETCDVYVKDKSSASLQNYATRAQSLILGSRTFRVFTSGGKWNTKGGCEDHGSKWEDPVDEGECSEAGFLLGIENMSSTYESELSGGEMDRTGTKTTEVCMTHYRESRVSIRDCKALENVTLLAVPSKCSAKYIKTQGGTDSLLFWSDAAGGNKRRETVEKVTNMRKKFLHVKYSEYSNIREGALLRVPSCSKQTPCICRRRLHPTSTIMQNSQAIEGGAIHCSSSQAAANENAAEFSRTLSACSGAAKSIRMSSSSHVSSTFACFSKGVVFF